MAPPGKLTKAPWREQAFARIAEQRFVLGCIEHERGAMGPIPADAIATIDAHWTAAAEAAARSSFRQASVARVTSHLDAVDTSLLRLAPVSYVFGQMPGLIARVRRYLPPEDPRREDVETLAKSLNEQAKAAREGGAAVTLTDPDRDLVVAAHHAADAEGRREITRLRSFKNVLLGTAVALAIGVIGLAVLGFVAPDKLPMCFSPDDTIVCTTSTTPIDPKLTGAHDGAPPPTASASDAAAPVGQPSAFPAGTVDANMRADAGPWDIAVVEIVGLLAAALAAATSLRKIRGTSTPFSLPTALALLKLPTGALTAVLGLILMRGQFIPGLSALDTAGQIVSWAVLLGYSQQLLTRFVDQRAQTVLDDFGRSAEDKVNARAVVDAQPATVV